MKRNPFADDQDSLDYGPKNLLKITLFNPSWQQAAAASVRKANRFSLELIKIHQKFTKSVSTKKINLDESKGRWAGGETV